MNGLRLDDYPPPQPGSAAATCCFGCRRRLALAIRCFSSRGGHSQPQPCGTPVRENCTQDSCGSLMPSAPTVRCKHSSALAITVGPDSVKRNGVGAHDQNGVRLDNHQPLRRPRRLAGSSQSNRAFCDFGHLAFNKALVEFCGLRLGGRHEEFSRCPARSGSGSGSCCPGHPTSECRDTNFARLLWRYLLAVPGFFFPVANQIKISAEPSDALPMFWLCSDHGVPLRSGGNRRG